MGFPAHREPQFPVKANPEDYTEQDKIDAYRFLKSATNGMMSNLANEDMMSLQKMGILSCDDYVGALAEYKRLHFLQNYGPHAMSYFKADDAHRSADVKTPDGLVIYPHGKISDKVLDIVDASNKAIEDKRNDEGSFEELALKLEAAENDRDDARDDLHMQCVELTSGRQDPATALLNRVYTFLENSHEVEEEMVSKIVGTPVASDERLMPPKDKGIE